MYLLQERMFLKWWQKNIQNDYKEKSLSGYKILKKHPYQKNGIIPLLSTYWKYSEKLVQWIEGVAQGSLELFVAPCTFTTKKNCQTNRNQSVINTEKGEKRNLKQFKCLKTPQMSKGTWNRRETSTGSLRERFENKISMIEKSIWQDEKDFSLEVSINLQNDCVYGKGKNALWFYGMV